MKITVPESVVLNTDARAVIREEFEREKMEREEVKRREREEEVGGRVCVGGV